MTRYEVKAIDGPLMKDWNDGVFLCLRYTPEAAARAAEEFAPRWPGKKFVVIEVTTP